MMASEAWALFGEGNGAASLEQLLARIGRYRSGHRVAVIELAGLVSCNGVWVFVIVFAGP